MLHDLLINHELSLNPYNISPFHFTCRVLTIS